MTTFQRILLIATAATLLGACGSSPPPPPPIEDTAFKDLKRAEDKARGVADTVMQQKDSTDQQIGDQEK
jgi:hypothetical protein